MQLKLKDNSIIDIQEFSLNGFNAHTQLESLEDYQNLLSQLSDEAVTDFIVLKEDGTTLIELTNATLESSQVTKLFNGEEDVFFADFSFKGELYNEYLLMLNLLNNGESE